MPPLTQGWVADDYGNFRLQVPSLCLDFTLTPHGRFWVVFPRRFDVAAAQHTPDPGNSDSSILFESASEAKLWVAAAFADIMHTIIATEKSYE